MPMESWDRYPRYGQRFVKDFLVGVGKMCDICRCMESHPPPPSPAPARLPETRPKGLLMTK